MVSHETEIHYRVGQTEYKMRVLILEDDQDQALLLQAWLTRDGHRCHIVESGTAFLKAFGQESFDLVMLDWMVPKGNGMEILQSIRKHFNSTLPVVFVTQRQAEEDIVAALENRADDYMVKPLREAETLARVKALARRSGDQTGSQPSKRSTILPIPLMRLNMRLELMVSCLK
jgi:two-component system response regulator RegX3